MAPVVTLTSNPQSYGQYSYNFTSLWACKTNAMGEATATLKRGGTNINVCLIHKHNTPTYPSTPNWPADHVVR